MRLPIVVSTLLTSVSVAPGIAADVAGLPTPLVCAGGEPFWGLSIKDGRDAVYTWDNQPVPWTVRSISRAAGRITTWRVMFEGVNRQALIFDEGQQSCSDTDGDEPLAYGILLEDGEGLLRGCCNPVGK
ncbi:MAG: hypothetical protein GC190_05110 [Alphaproteobacteria bacterium]|nr:hypothetical protein [Alphaproteobacteria bacterium]